ncbi:MAG: hypothetical protein A2418_01070 [Candidatus Brennerbacteria bacterium RIFOXYC1_FULL_41_11]|uniref:Hydrolase TatD n=1 Tax=Candidatus Brennerbacteria bacterium RIFOXYD1_FULL_41_16 TaxID=1797529 RepID=A0A1G1XMS8_9BACT|nr:MAG: Hydrolase, TatD family [Parcubacteria group bacterium GW2011_GWB1_41_4]OGY39400.1 MAG: hypothetical protein A2391_02940 [Candidatus Brennerbacteria bacterium RIFOXYB1_FULL_41_13]OGY40034.1 MAG: hypothetical protein A2418_01070 [Candidatus Brennerbacteria bacterium RIFOXYC1_FULL_41_11]OGY40966.1 MAG: hypothetical protein A2570_00540 [Candidatus Brennerbacteria bacterium RIFOXYD1_FULL_41_16]
MLFDTHCHFPHAKYKKTSEDVVADARMAEVSLLMNIGTSLKESRRAIETTKKFDDVYCSIGIYPHDDRDHAVNVLEKKLEEFLSQPSKIKAIGEIGLDISNWQGGRNLEEQLELFEIQIQLAVKNHLPIVIHNRNGDKEVLELVEKYSKDGLTGVCHCFTQDWEYAKKMLDFEFYLGFGGIITYQSGEYLSEIIKKMPLDRVLVETDSPYLLPEPLRTQNKGEANEPQNVVLVAQKIAEIRSVSYDEVCKITYENGKRIFKID